MKHLPIAERPGTRGWLAGPALALLAAGSAGAQMGPAPAGQEPPAPPLPAVVSVTPITGTAQTFNPVAAIANLDAGDFVAGRSVVEVQGGLFLETFLGFLWTPSSGATVFSVPVQQHLNPNLQLPMEIADDGTVVGVNLFTDTLDVRPFQWTARAGFEFLPLPGADLNGNAVAVSSDGRVAGGSIDAGFAGTSRAAVWVDKSIALLGAPGQHSLVHDLSASGAVAVGEAGADPAGAQATRWHLGVEVGLGPVQGATASAARFSSRSGRSAIGTATVDGRDVLVRWDRTARPAVHLPPDGLSVAAIRAINPRATAAVGALEEDGDQRPFLWRQGRGFEVLGELGLESEYDLSEACDVSDDGRRVVGRLQASVIFEGDPPTTGFLWTPETGTRALDDLLEASGQAPLGLFTADAISGDGRRVLTTGVEQPSVNDTSAVLLELD